MEVVWNQQFMRTSPIWLTINWYVEPSMQLTKLFHGISRIRCALFVFEYTRLPIPQRADNHGITLDHTQEKRGCDFVRASDYVYVLEWPTRHVSNSGGRSMFPPNH